MNYRTVILLLSIVCTEALATSYMHVSAQSYAESIAASVEKIILDIGAAPVQEDWPNILFVKQEKYPGWDGPYLGKMATDPWGNGFQLKINGGVFVGIYSLGKNGLDDNGAEDDITSWGGFDKNIYYPNWRRDVAVRWLVLCFIALFPIFIFVRYIRKNKLPK